MSGAAGALPLASEVGALTAEDATQLQATLLSLHDTLVRGGSLDVQGGHGALVQPLCAILGAFATARTRLGEGTAAGTAAAARLVTPTRTAECILACLHAIFGRHKLSDPSQARLRSTSLVRAAPPAELVSAAQPAQVVGVSQSLVLVLGLPHDDSSEELRLGAVRALAALFEGSCVDELSAEANAPLLGHALSLLLQVAECEASAGDRGSRALRAEAFRALEVLLRQVGDPDALAFFLPGISSGLCLAIRRSTTDAPGGAGPTSAAASADAVVHALAALSTLLRIVVGEAACAAVLDESSDECAQPPGMADAPRLLAAICGREDDARERATLADASPSAPASVHASVPERMRVERSASWLQATASHLGRMLPPLFGMLRMHPRSSVRTASVHAADELLRHCAHTLPACTTACLECLLCLAHDLWPQVAEAACRCLQQRSSPETRANAVFTADAIPWPKLEALLVAQSTAFEAACKRSEADATVAARLLAGAIGVCGPVRAVSALLAQPRRAQMCRRLIAAFALSSRAIQPASSAAFVANEPMQLLASKDAAFLSSGMMLPRRHARYSLLTSEESYIAGANVARLCGRAASLASASALIGLIDELLSQLRACVDEKAQEWRLRAASAMLVLSEVIYGASPAWTDISGWRHLDAASWHMNEAGMFQAALVSTAAAAVDEVMSPALFSASEAADILTQPKLARDAACLTAACTEFFGVVARSVGVSFVTHPHLLPTVLTPVLEKLGDPSREVSGAAAAALLSAATYCGYDASLQMLVTAHCDYIIDALCRQLRHLEVHPHAPLLFSALLRRCGVARMLLPILTEPLQSAASAVSVLHRGKNASLTRTFLEVLGEVAHAAHLEALSVTASDEQLTEAQMRQLVTITRVAVISGNAAAPLGLDRNPLCAVLAIDAITDAVGAVAAANAPLRSSSAASPSTSGDAGRAELPPLLPYVHANWPFYVSVLAGGHHAAASRALERLPLIAEAAGGDFIRQRFASDLWEPLRRLLLHGSLQAHPAADAAPGTISRMQHAALSCLLAIAGSEHSRDALADVVADAAEVLAAVIRSSDAPELHARAEELLTALGGLDPDAIWLVRFKLRRVQPPPCPELPSLLACR